MQRYDFIANKYGKNLQVDLGRMETLEGYVLSNQKHFITFYEVLVILNGKGHFSLDNKKASYKKGTVIVTLPNQIRQWEVIQSTKGYSFFFEGEFLNTFFRDDIFLNRFAIFDYKRPSIFVQLSKNNLKKCTWIFNEVEKEFNLLRGDSSHILRSLLYFSISLIDREFRERNQLSKSDKHPIIYRFQKLLDKHINEWHTVKEYALALKVSHNQLNKLCKENLLRTALQLIHERLMIEVKREVLFSNNTISEISNKLNFSDVANFNRFFKKMTGKTANQFKKTI